MLSVSRRLTVPHSVNVSPGSLLLIILLLFLLVQINLVAVLFCIVVLLLYPTHGVTVMGVFCSVNSCFVVSSFVLSESQPCTRRIS